MKEEALLTTSNGLCGSVISGLCVARLPVIIDIDATSDCTLGSLPYSYNAESPPASYTCVHFISQQEANIAVDISEKGYIKRVLW